MKTIKGTPLEKWAEVAAAQHEPFVYIMGNGSKWAGDEEDDISALIEVLKSEPLDARTAPFYSVNPCEGVVNPEWTYGSDGTVEHWIDGPRLYACDSVVRFSGNFLTVSHGFSIDTNDAETIATLTALIDANTKRADYLQAA